MKTIQECINEVGELAISICKDAKVLPKTKAKYKDEWMREGVVTLGDLFQSNKIPTTNEAIKLSYDLLDHFGSEAIHHTHGPDHGIVLKSIEQEWARKGIEKLSEQIIKFGTELHKN